MCADNDDWTVRRPCLDVDEPLLDLVHALLAVRDLPNDLFGEKEKHRKLKSGFDVRLTDKH
jgi:hypothetical protein